MAKQNDDPVLPYPDPDGTMTGGWSGSEASHERAKSEAADGTLQKRQQEVMNFVARRKWSGATWREVSSTLGLHHGQASGALSNLHKAGRVVRLTDKRNRCSIYVYPEYVDGRSSKPYGRVRPGTDPTGPEVQSLLEKAYRDGMLAGEQRYEEDILVFINRMLEATRPGVVQTHTHDCYRKHPHCALKAVQVYVAKSGVRV